MRPQGLYEFVGRPRGSVVDLVLQDHVRIAPPPLYVYTARSTPHVYLAGLIRSPHLCRDGDVSRIVVRVDQRGSDPIGVSDVCARIILALRSDVHFER